VSTGELFRDLERRARLLEPALRAALAERWSLAARFEHASIASFNRFSLELLALGAPAELVAASNRAALQEVAHARASFALASAYAGRDIGPGALDIAGLGLDRVALDVLASATVSEGCIDETLAAAEAAGAEERASEPAVRWVLATIAREEREHAALAFRFVRWACDVGGEPVRESARQTFHAALALRRASRQPAPDSPALARALEEHGQLAPTTRAALRVRTCREVLEPAARELFG
jgi:hypothetical protein